MSDPTDLLTAFHLLLCCINMIFVHLPPHLRKVSFKDLGTLDSLSPPPPPRPPQQPTIPHEQQNSKSTKALNNSSKDCFLFSNCFFLLLVPLAANFGGEEQDGSVDTLSYLCSLNSANITDVEAIHSFLVQYLQMVNEGEATREERGERRERREGEKAKERDVKLKYLFCWYVCGVQLIKNNVLKNNPKKVKSPEPALGKR